MQTFHLLLVLKEDPDVADIADLILVFNFEVHHLTYQSFRVASIRIFIIEDLLQQSRVPIEIIYFKPVDCKHPVLPFPLVVYLNHREFFVFIG